MNILKTVLNSINNFLKWLHNYVSVCQQRTCANNHCGVEK